MSRTDELAAYSDKLSIPYIATVQDSRLLKQLPRIQSSTGLVVDQRVKSVLESQGFTFDTERDNKSVSHPESLLDALSLYFEEQDWNPDPNSFEVAEAYVKAVFGRPKDQPYLIRLSLDAALAHEIHTSHSSGAPEFVQKGQAFYRDLERAQRIARGEQKAPACTPYRRVQHHETGPRTRLIWGYPLSMTLLEACFFRPLIEQFLTIRSPMAFGLTQMEMGGALAKLEDYGTRVSIDFSRFDARLHERIINIVLNAAESWFDFQDDPEGWQMWKAVRRYFVCTPIFMPDARLYLKRRGVGSGSYGTQWVDSGGCFFIVQYAHHKTTGRTVDWRRMFVLGDDCVYGCSETVSLTKLQLAISDLGSVLNTEKSKISRFGQSCDFLGHEWKCGFAHRDPEDLRKRAVFPERHWRITGHKSDERVVSISLSCANGLKDLAFPYFGGMRHYGQAYSLPVRVRSITGWQEFRDIVLGEEPEGDPTTVGRRVYTSRLK
jgi:hypothetical protein